MIDNKLADKLLLMIKNDIHVYNHLLEKKYDEREEVDEDVIIESNFNEVVHVDAYHIDRKIEYLKGPHIANDFRSCTSTRYNVIWRH